jgi:hypothetical protein
MLRKLTAGVVAALIALSANATLQAQRPPEGHPGRK